LERVAEALANPEALTSEGRNKPKTNTKISEETKTLLLIYSLVIPIKY